MDAAIDQWALETGQTDGAAINTASAASYLKTAWKTTDLLGGSYSYTAGVGASQVVIAATTKTASGGRRYRLGSLLRPVVEPSAQALTSK